jgi:hypothetical protein
MVWCSLRGDLAICFDVDVLIGLEDGDLVVRQIGTVHCHISATSLQWRSIHPNVPKALDQLVLVCNLAALIGDFLLCSIILRSDEKLCLVEVGSTYASS